MKNILTVKQMREAESFEINNGTPSRELMYRAGKGIASYIINNLGATDKIAVVCGHGNNGGDGMVAAWLLDMQGVDVTVFFIGNANKLTADSGHFFEKCKHLVKDMEKDLCEYTVILDAIYGTGFHGELSDDIRWVTRKINDSKAFVISADIPSGVNGETGQVSKDAVRADVTLCIEAIKKHCACGISAEYAGRLETVSIGINVTSQHKLLEMEDINTLLPPSNKAYHKNCYGSVGIIGGCQGMEGAAMLSAMSASRCGVGKVSILSDLPYYQARPHHIMQRQKFDINSIDALAYGMGAGRGDECIETLKKLLLTDVALVLDADAVYMLNDELKELIKNRSRNHAVTILTPHIGEAARLTDSSADTIHANPIDCARDISNQLGCITVLKSWYTVICYGDLVRVHNMPQRSLAKAGSGDCLAGIVAAMLARGVKQGSSCFDAVCASVLLHAQAGKRASQDFGSASATATDIANSIRLDG